MDEIERKLARIDRQLAGVNFHKRIISTCPLVIIAVGLIAGILLQSIVSESRLIWLWMILLTLCLLSAIIFFIIQTKNRLSINTPVLLGSFALICFICLGAIRLIGFHRLESNDISNLIGDEPKLATIRGLIVTEPYINDNKNWKFGKFKYGGPSSSFYAEVTQVEAADGWAEAAGTVRVSVSEPTPDLKPGDYIQIYCQLDRFNPPTNPGQFDMVRYMARKNVFIAAFVKSRGGIKILQSVRNDKLSGFFTKLKNRIRQFASEALLDIVSLEKPGRGLLEALLLGYRGNIDNKTYAAFRKTGLLHFISLSGMHLGILAGMVWWLCKTAGLMKPARAVVCMIVVTVFLLIVPPRAPTLRAAVICFIYCLSFIFRRHPNPLNSLSLAAIILLLIRPTHIFEAGWQLSFGTVLGIILLSDRICFFMYEQISNLLRRKKEYEANLFFYGISKTARYFLRLFSVGFAAWIGGAGILLYHFYTITPLSSIWTILVFPLVSLILILGFLKIILFFLSTVLSYVLGFTVTILSSWLIRIVKLIASLDLTQVVTGHVPLVLVIFYYCTIIFAGFIHFRSSRSKRIICTVIVLMLFVFLGSVKWQRTHSDNLVITFLDVGHGQAIFTQFPGKTKALFDAGSRSRSDIGRRIVNPFLDYSGISKIDYVFISHSDTDHINGIPEIIEHCDVDGVYATDDFLGKTNRMGTEKYLNDCFLEKDLQIKSLDNNINSHSSADIKILWPSEEASVNEVLGDNDKSQVSLIEFAGVKVLLCSDIEKYAQRELFWLYPDLKADIVFVPHHGSARTLNDDFLQKLDPDFLIYSCDQSQYQGQSHIVKESNNVKSFYTPKHGAIVVKVGGDGLIKIKTFMH
ncbi:MAG: DNA internalization-related competence protein ComEC/Rec2 [Sedimentisphaerales bacterium]|nr:DNA internalization-related competence protein ComEC/Rec2 [Sedimentisphaerales bacterium]